MQDTHRIDLHEASVRYRQDLFDIESKLKWKDSQLELQKQQFSHSKIELEKKVARVESIVKNKDVEIRHLKEYIAQQQSEHESVLAEHIAWGLTEAKRYDSLVLQWKRAVKSAEISEQKFKELKEKTDGAFIELQNLRNDVKDRIASTSEILQDVQNKGREEHLALIRRNELEQQNRRRLANERYREEQRKAAERLRKQAEEQRRSAELLNREQRLLEMEKQEIERKKKLDEERKRFEMEKRKSEMLTKACQSATGSALASTTIVEQLGDALTMWQTALQDAYSPPPRKNRTSANGFDSFEVEEEEGNNRSYLNEERFDSRLQYF
eukprot:g1706.t1